jgi:hypothetical protein
MAKNVQVKSVPDEVHLVLRRRAGAAGMSLQEYLLDHLERFAAQPTMAEVLDRMESRRGGRLSARDAVRLRDEGRAERR